jgi:Family of unknown function (DUF6399)
LTGKRTPPFDCFLIQSRGGRMNVTISNATVDTNRDFFWNQKERSIGLASYSQLRSEGLSQVDAASKIGIPRTTLEAWISRGKSIDADPELIAFFQGVVGTAFLHRLVTAAHFVFIEAGACGIRFVSLFLNLVGLDQFVAASFEAQRKLNVTIQESIVDHAVKETQRLGANMPKKNITVAQDETFTCGLTLVAIEPESNFIILEKPTEKRDTETWDAAMKEALEPLNCRVIQSTSDEATAIISHIEGSLKAHHSPDLFHQQQDLSRATSGPMAAKVRSAESDQEKAGKLLESSKSEADKYHQNADERGPGRPPDFQKQLNAAESKLKEAIEEVNRLKRVQDDMRAAIRGVSEVYHYADPLTGKRATSGRVQNKIQEKIDTVRSLAEQEGLSDASYSKINKAERVLPKMKSTIEFVNSYIQSEIDLLQLTSDQKKSVKDQLVPAYYLERIAEQETKEEALPILELANQIKEPLFALNGIFADLAPTKLDELKIKARSLANVFQRSSSCVEGRNGVLSFRHHELHSMSERKRKTLTALHNFFIERSDGSTAAERFFESKPKDLFESILNKVTIPTMPRTKSKRSDA